METTGVKSVLVVEDDSMLCTIFEMFINELGYEHMAVANGEEALALCKEKKPDMVLMDIHLDGELDGIATADIMGKEMNIPVVYISGDHDSKTVQKAVLPNTYGFLLKPIHKEILKLNIEFGFAKHKLLQKQNV